MKKITNWIKTTIILFSLWFIFSGRTETKFLIMGICSAALVSAVCQGPMWISGSDPDKDKKYFLLDVPVGKYIVYWAWLFVQIVKSCISVALIVISPHMKINPHIIEFDFENENPMAVTLLVNSIILTPGTVTVDVVDEKHFKVHALNDMYAEDLLGGEMQRRIAGVFAVK